MRIIISYIISFTLTFFPILPYANANIQIDGTTNTSIDQTQNQVPIVNIAPPSGSGVSKNNFTNFNVGKEGVILNNSKNVGVSKLGGAIYGNENLINGEARIILNQVTSNNISKLEGYTEIFGKKAEYILANPNGITCNGCGFINTSRLTLITGIPTIDNLGKIQNIAIKDGIINIFGSGLDASETDYFDIISKAVQISGQIRGGKNLTIKTGNDTFNYQTKNITSNNIQNLNFAIDSSALGGMYAGKITLIATQNGIGVKTDGNLIASTDNLTIDANGKIEINNKSYSKQNITLTSNDINIKGDYLKADNNVTINAVLLLTNSSVIYADNDITVNETQNINNQSGIIFSNNNLSINTHNLNSLNGEILSNNNIETYNINSISGDVKATNNVIFNTITDGFTINQNSTILAKNGKIKIDLSSNNFTRSGNYTIEDIFINNGSIEGGLLFLTDLDLKTSQLTNLNKIENLEVHSNNFINDQDLNHLNNIDIYSKGSFTNNKNITLATHNKILIDAKGTFTNKGEIAAKSINSTGYYDLYSQGNFINEGLITSGNGNSIININGNNLDNKLVILGKDKNNDDIKSRISSEGNLNINITDGNLNNYSQVSTGKDLTISTNNDINNNSGSLLYGNKNLTLNADNILNENAEIISFSGILKLQKNENGDKNTKITNKAGTIKSYGTSENHGIIINTQNLENLATYNATSSWWEGEYRDYQTPKNNEWDAGKWDDYYAWRYHVSNRTVKKRALISSKNDIIINATNSRNEISDIEAQRHIKITGQNFTNTNYAQTSKGKYGAEVSCAKGAPNCAFHGGGANRLETNWSGWWNKNESRSTGWLLRSSTKYKIPNQSHLYNYVNSEVKANQNLEMLLIDSNNQQHTDTSTTPDKNINGLTGLQNNGIIKGGNSINIIADNIGNTGSNSSTTNNNSFNINVPSPASNGLFKINPNNKLKPLIETNVAFLDTSKFLGSNYFLTRIGFDSDTNIRLLGDAVYETQMIENTILKQTGKHFLKKNITNSYDQIQFLYDNAIEANKDLELKVGISLTSNQISALKNDIIWMVEKEVEGETVLVPQLYLSQATLANIDEDKSGTISSDGDITLIAHNDIINEGGTIESDKDLSLIANNNIINKTNTDGSSILSKASLNSGKNLLIQSGNSFINVGADINSKGDVDIQANNSVVFTVASLYNKNITAKKHHSGYTRTENIELTNIASTLNTGGNLTIDAKNNATFLGSEFNIAKNADINAKKIDILSSEEVKNSITTNVSIAKKSKTSWSGKKTTKTTTTTTETYQGNTNFNSTTFNIKGEGKFKAEEDIKIAAVDGKNSVFGKDISNIALEGNEAVEILENTSFRKSFTIKDTKTEVTGGLGGKADVAGDIGNALGSTIDTADNLTDDPANEFRTNAGLRMAGRAVATYYGGSAGAAAYEGALAYNDGDSLENAGKAGARAYLTNQGGGAGAAAVAVYDAEKSGERDLGNLAKEAVLAYASKQGGKPSFLVNTYKAHESGASNEDAFKEGLYGYIESESGEATEEYGIDKKLGKAAGKSLTTIARNKDKGENNNEAIERAILEGGKSYATSYSKEEYGKGAELTTKVFLNTADNIQQKKDWQEIARKETSDAVEEYAQHNYEENKEDRYFAYINDTGKEFATNTDNYINEKIKDGLNHLNENSTQYLSYAGAGLAAYALIKNKDEINKSITQGINNTIVSTQNQLGNLSQELKNNENTRLAGAAGAYYYKDTEGLATYQTLLAINDGKSNERILVEGIKGYAAGKVIRGGERLVDKAGDLYDSMNGGMDYDKKTALREAMMRLQEDHPEMTDIINNNEQYSTAQLQVAVATLSNYVQEELGNDGVDVNLYRNNNSSKAMYDRDGKRIYVNLNKTNVANTKDLLMVLGHENSHANDHSKNLTYNSSREIEAHKMGSAIADIWSTENNYNNNDVGENELLYKSDYALLRDGTSSANKVKNPENFEIFGFTIRWGSTNSTTDDWTVAGINEDKIDAYRKSKEASTRKVVDDREKIIRRQRKNTSTKR